MGQVWILDGFDNRHQFSVHLVDITFAHRKIIGGIVLSLTGFSCTLDVQLQCTCKIGDISHDFNIIQCFKIINPQLIRIPDLGIDCPGLVLQNHIFIWFSVFCHCCLFMFAKVNSGHPASLKKFLNKFHIISFRLSA